MARYKFTATQGVHFSEDGVDVWAHFTRNPGDDVYTFETDDAAAAKRVRAVKDYGIAEVKSSTAKSGDAAGE